MWDCFGRCLTGLAKEVSSTSIFSWKVRSFYTMKYWLIFFELKLERNDWKKSHLSFLILQITLPYKVLFGYSRNWKKEGIFRYSFWNLCGHFCYLLYHLYRERCVHAYLFFVKDKYISEVFCTFSQEYIWNSDIPLKQCVLQYLVLPD